MMVAEHTHSNGLYVAIERITNRMTRKPAYAVRYSLVRPYLLTWNVFDTEAEAREAANKVWTRHTVGEKMIACGPAAI